MVVRRSERPTALAAVRRTCTAVARALIAVCFISSGSARAEAAEPFERVREAPELLGALEQLTHGGADARTEHVVLEDQHGFSLRLVRRFAGSPCCGPLNFRRLLGWGT